MSRFITDMGDQVAASANEPRVVPEQDFYSDELFAVGDTVRSASFGNGEVIEVDELALISNSTMNQTKTKR